MIQRLKVRPSGSAVRALLAVCGAAALLGAFGPRGALGASPRPAAGAAPAVLRSSAWPSPALDGLRREVFDLAIGAASCAVRAGDVPMPATLSVIDYSLPSTRPRLWVFDLQAQALLYRELVAHGQGSGGDLATRFSNEPETHASSLGLFVTQNTYVGKNGYSLRLEGLDRGFNDHALARAIVMHGAQYVSNATARALGRLGRSWGCPALREGIARELIDRVKGGSLVFAYYPDPRWLRASRYLGECLAATATRD